MAAHGSLGMLLWHEDILGELIVVRDYKSVVFLCPVIGAHNLLHAPGDDPDYLGLLPLPLALRQQGHLHGVLVERAAGLALGYIKVRFAPLILFTTLVALPEMPFICVFYLNEAEAFGIADESPHQSPAACFHIFCLGGERQLSLCQKFPQDFTEFLPVLFRHLHECSHLLLLHGNVDGIVHQLTDYFLPGLP